MSIKFSVLRMGDRSDRGQNGECGFVIVGQDIDDNTAVTIQCKVSHKHSKECAQRLLDQKILPAGSGPKLDTVGSPLLDDNGNQVIEQKFKSPREEITKIITDRQAARAAEVAIEVEPFPKIEVEKIIDGKRKKVMEDDRKLL